MLVACKLDRRFRFLRGALRQRVFNDEVAAFDESLFLKSFPEAPDVSGGWWPDPQKADTARHRLLLRAGGEWTRDRRTTEKCNELAPPHCRSALKRVLLALSSVTRKFGLNNGLPGCPLWVKSDICTAIGHVRFTPESGH
jgi:hypothetical protein